jgi:ABC-2 type transport system permease protein
MPPMLRALVKLTWLELKIFIREPLGFIGSVAIPVILFVVLARAFGPRVATATRAVPAFGQVLPAFSALFIAMGAVSSLVTIISIYREGGILKRLRATPLSPVVILAAHVVVKLLLTAATLVALALAGRRVYPIDPAVPLGSFAVAVLFTTWSILSIGFVIASIVPTARFAQPIAALVFYPMIALSGLFFPVDVLPTPAAALARVLPLTAGASLLNGIWKGDSWLVHGGDVVVLAATFVLCTALSSRVFRWE